MVLPLGRVALSHCAFILPLLPSFVAHLGSFLTYVKWRPEDEVGVGLWILVRSEVRWQSWMLWDQLSSLEPVFISSSSCWSSWIVQVHSICISMCSNCITLEKNSTKVIPRMNATPKLELRDPIIFRVFSLAVLFSTARATSLQTFDWVPSVGKVTCLQLSRGVWNESLVLSLWFRW
jgi:hypothetical protein